MKYFLAISIFILNLLDGLFTEYAIRFQGAIELNPLIHWVMNVMGTYWLIPKALLGLLPFYFIIKFWNIHIAAKIMGILLFTLYFALVAYEVVALSFYTNMVR